MSVFPFFLYSSRLVTCLHQVYDAYHNQNSCEVLVSDIVNMKAVRKLLENTSLINKMYIRQAIGFRIKAWIFLHYNEFT